MTLKLADLRRGDADRYSWYPTFDSAVAYENEHWWDAPNYDDDSTWYVQVLEDDAEVARVKLDDPGDINPEYAGVPIVGPERLEILFIEVATAAQGRGVGTEVVRALERRHTDRRFFAYSKDAHGFWASLGWERFDHPESEQSYGPLFIQSGQ
ncbi:GNAT family N-acetyltransferase [Rhodococcus artemisiae]|uniref:GNAT family N-acetyltransferase n=1 Tax=Rhodococcus artemisiae TaxID=714159 RepID=A0ABU7LL53_9NOCA|nr:GNAT family N-acetyltransferase [Rhodococcus artemisiae]MEE2062273.1 GNAT family N-acetyltransferase [Rhodococcus artemisiae]